MKNPQIEEPKVQSTKILPGSQHFESSKKAWKEKKKKQQQRNQKRWKGFTPAIRVNVAQIGEPHQKKKKKYCSDKALCDTSQIKHYNCQKMGHYATICSKPKN